MKNLLLFLVFICSASACEAGKNKHHQNYVRVKYRSNPVDIAHPRFEYLETSSSSFVRGAWYDRKNRYMIIRLNQTFYHYCGLPKREWKRFKVSKSYGGAYNYSIKRRYDCRFGYVPLYLKSVRRKKSIFRTKHEK